MVVMKANSLATILWSGAAIAILDIANAMTFWTVYNGATPQVILQSIAAGLMGRDAFSGGAPTAWLGAFLHFFISRGIVTVYFIACRLWPMLLSRPFSMASPMESSSISS
jgi:hypothetical protein